MESRERLEEFYHNQGMSLADIGAVCGVSRMTVFNWLKEYNIPRRSKSKARFLALKKGKFEDKEYHDFDRRFFEDWSPSMAYLLGLVFADGHVRHDHDNGHADHRLTFGFQAASELPYLINSLLSSQKPPLEIMSNESPQLRLAFGDEQLIHRLIDLGVPSGKKSLIMEYPDMPSGLDRHFIRGFFDGDGGVYYSGKAPKTGWRPIQVRFYSSSLAFLNGVSQHLLSCGFVGYIYEEGRRIHKLPQGDTLYIEGAYRLVYNRRDDCLGIYDFLYNDVSEGRYAKGRKLKFKTLLVNGFSS